MIKKHFPTDTELVRRMVTWLSIKDVNILIWQIVKEEQKEQTSNYIF